MVSFFIKGVLKCQVTVADSSVSEILAIKELLAQENGVNRYEVDVVFGT